LYTHLITQLPNHPLPPFPPSLPLSLHSAIYARKQAEAEELRVKIMANARYAEEEAYLRSSSNSNDHNNNNDNEINKNNNNGGNNDNNDSVIRTIEASAATGALPRVLETGLEALRDFDENGRRNRKSAAAVSSSLVAGVRGGGGGGERGVGGGQADSSDEEDEMEEGKGGREGMPAGLGGRKRQKTMADVVQLHRDLSDLQRTRTELRWLLGQVERLEYESL